LPRVSLVTEELRRDARELVTDRLGWMTEREVRDYRDQLERMRAAREALGREQTGREHTGREQSCRDQTGRGDRDAAPARPGRG
jgi:predicted transposase YdaD